MREIKLRGPHHQDERGAVLLIVAVFMIVAVVMLAAVVDLGGLRQEKREVTLSTDAAALAGADAADYAGNAGNADCEQVPTQLDVRVLEPTHLFVDDVVKDYLTENGGSAYVDCVVTRNGTGGGFVRVEADEVVGFSIGPAIGQQSGNVAGTSTASVSRSRGGGLRPIATCLYTQSLDTPSVDLAAIVQANSDKGALPVPVRVTLPVQKLNQTGSAGSGVDPACEADGHFGQADFSDDGNGQGSCGNSPQPNTYCDYLENGWFGTVDNPMSGDPGQNYGPQVRTEFNALEGMTFWIPIHSKVLDCTGNPKPAACASVTGTPFLLSHFVEVELVDSCLDQNQNAACRINKSGTKYQWLKFDILRVESYKSAGPSPTADAKTEPARICATDDDVSYC